MPLQQDGRGNALHLTGCTCNSIGPGGVSVEGQRPVSSVGRSGAFAPSVARRRVLSYRLSREYLRLSR